MSQRLLRFSLVCLSLAFIALWVMVGCTKEPVEIATMVPADKPADKPMEKPAERPTETAMPTTAFRVELPVTVTPTTVVEEATSEGTPLPTDTPGPTSTPRPTRTPWPTRAPTSAPVDDPGMTYVSGGEFIFGSDETKEDESPRQTIYVDSFNIDIQPVTCAEYKGFVDATGHRLPRNWKDGQIPPGQESHPVVWVSWNDALAYAEWAGKRLPTEVEWEKAARGIDGRVYPWGDTFDSSRCNSREANLKKTNPVDEFPEGASPHGAMDMSGNVWEWTADWYQGYPQTQFTSNYFGETYKVLRGGGWFSEQDLVRTTKRNANSPDAANDDIGFRCAR